MVRDTVSFYTGGGAKIENHWVAVAKKCFKIRLQGYPLLQSNSPINKISFARLLRLIKVLLVHKMFRPVHLYCHLQVYDIGREIFSCFGIFSPHRKSKMVPNRIVVLSSFFFFLLISLTAYQLFIGYLILKIDPSINV